MNRHPLFLLLLVLLPLTAQAQDTAEAIVARYLRLLNIEGLPADSMLVMTTTISFHNSTDTFTMTRRYQAGEMMRVDIYKGDSLMTGLCTNGRDRYREFVHMVGWWVDQSPETFERDMQAYDFRGPLHHWRERGITLAYEGVTTYKGQRMQVVKSVQEKHFNRHYLFEEGSGLLVAVLEDNEVPDKRREFPLRGHPIDYKITHEYLPVGASLLPTQESFMRNEVLTVMESTVHFEPRNVLLFNQD